MQVTDCFPNAAFIFQAQICLEFCVLFVFVAFLLGLYCCGFHSAHGLVLMSWRISGYSWSAMLPRGLQR